MGVTTGGLELRRAVVGGSGSVFASGRPRTGCICKRRHPARGFACKCKPRAENTRPGSGRRSTEFKYYGEEQRHCHPRTTLLRPRPKRTSSAR